MTTVSVFGGTGFLGRRLVRRLAAERMTVRVAVRHADWAGNTLRAAGLDRVAVFCELRVASTGEPLHQRETSAMKLAMLENGLEILVPVFIRVDDIVRVATATGKYLERARAKGS